MAQQLIDSLSSEFDPSSYHDQYREKVLELIEKKASGEEIAVQPEAPEPAKVPDLMAALEASLAAVKDPKRQEEGVLGVERLQERLDEERLEVQVEGEGLAGASPSRTTPACAGCGRRPSGPRAPRRARGPSPRRAAGRPAAA